LRVDEFKELLEQCGSSWEQWSKNWEFPSEELEPFIIENTWDRILSGGFSWLLSPEGPRVWEDVYDKALNSEEWGLK